MMFSILVHMFSVYFMKAYRKPREFGWLSGMGLLGIASVFGFSGYLLPMDELSYFATKVGLEIPAAIPLIGPAIASMLRGGPDVSEFTVQRFFALHVVVLPALFLPLLGFHLWLVQKHGNAAPPSEEAKPMRDRKTMPFMPNFLRKDLAMWLISLNVLALLASVFPWQLGKQYDSLAPAPVGIHPEWYFMSPFEMLKLLGMVKWLQGEPGEIAGILLFTVGIALWVMIPFYDTSRDSGKRREWYDSQVPLLLRTLLPEGAERYHDAGDGDEQQDGCKHPATRPVRPVHEGNANAAVVRRGGLGG